MFNRFAASYLFPVAVVALSLAPGQWAEAGVRGNSYRVTGTFDDGGYECYIFKSDGRGPLTFGEHYYLELDYGLFSTWTSLGVLNFAGQSPVVVAQTGVSVLGLTISGARFQYEPFRGGATRLFSGYLDPRCGAGFQTELVRGFNTSTQAVWIIAEGEPLSAATYVKPSTNDLIQVQLPDGAQEVRFLAVLDAPGHPTVGQGIWRRGSTPHTTQILWNGQQLICNPEPPLP